MTRTRRFDRTRVLAAVLVVLAAVVTVRYLAVTWTGRMAVDSVLPYENLLLSDFRDAVWLPSIDLHAGLDPYDDAAFLAAHPGTQGYSPYTPSHLLLTFWTGWMSWDAGTLAWTALGALALAAMGAWAGVATLRFARPELRGAAVVAAGAGGVLLAWIWRPTSIALGLGQPSAVYGPAAAVAAAATVVAVGLSPRARIALAALAIGKPQMGIQLAVVAAATRQWRALLVGAGIAAVLSVAVAVAIAGDGVLGWVLALPAAVAGRHSRFDQRYTTGNPWIDVSATAHRLGLPDAAGPLLALAVLALGVIAALVLRRRGRPALGALTAMVTGLLVVPHCGYDVLVLLPVLMLAAVEVVGAGAGASRTVAAVALFPVAVSGLLPSFRLPLGPEGLEPALGQAVALLVAWVLLVVAGVLARRRAPVPVDAA